MKKKGLVKTVQVNLFSVSPKWFHLKTLKILINIKSGSSLSKGFPGPVWQDRSMYIRPSNKDPVEESCPGGVELRSLCIMCYTLLCEQLRRVQKTSSVEQLLVYLLLVWSEESPHHRVNRRSLVICVDPGYSWDTFSGFRTDMMKCSSRYYNHSHTVKGSEVFWFVIPFKPSKTSSEWTTTVKCQSNYPWWCHKTVHQPVSHRLYNENQTCSVLLPLVMYHLWVFHVTVCTHVA